MELEILKKLKEELEKDISNEAHVIFIFTKIRKILEIHKEQKQYKFLYLYCNWALHFQIERTEPIFQELIDFINGNDKGFLNFEFFKNDMLIFLNNYNLPTKIIIDAENYYRLIKILLDIYTDSPLIVKVSRVKIYIKNPIQPLEGFNISVAFKTEVI